MSLSSWTVDRTITRPFSPYRKSQVSWHERLFLSGVVLLTWRIYTKSIFENIAVEPLCHTFANTDSHVFNSMLSHSELSLFLSRAFDSYLSSTFYFISTTWKASMRKVYDFIFRISSYNMLISLKPDLTFSQPKKSAQSHVEQHSFESFLCQSK